MDVSEDPVLLLRVQEAARLLGVSRAFVYKLLAQGQIRTVKLGRVRRIPRTEVERLAREGAECK
jgi:excisionase family DNA binding protein